MFWIWVSTALAVELTYEEALDRALEANPSLLRVGANVDMANASVMASKSQFDPAMTAYGGRQYALDKGLTNGLAYESAGTRWTWGAGFSQNLPTGTSWGLDWTNYSSRTAYTLFLTDEQGVENEFVLGQTNLNLSVTQQLLKGYRMAYNLQPLRSAENALSQAEAALLQQRQDTLAGVAVAYWDLVYAQQAQALSEEALSVAREEERIVRAQLDAGNMAPVELTRVKAAVAQTELALLEANAAHMAASDALAVQLGLPIGDEIQPTSLPGLWVPDVDLATAVDEALDGNPNLHALRVTVQTGEAELVVAKHMLLPSLAATASIGYTGFDDQLGYPEAVSQFAAFELPTAYVGGTFSMPLGNRAARSDVMRQEAQLAQAMVDLELAQDTVAQQAAIQVRTLQTAERRLGLAELNLQLANETLAAEKALQEAGEAIQKDVLEAQRASNQAEVAMLQAQSDVRKAQVQLLALQGRL